jgi:hypothetical protein
VKEPKTMLIKIAGCVPKNSRKTNKSIIKTIIYDKK